MLLLIRNLQASVHELCLQEAVRVTEIIVPAKTVVSDCAVLGLPSSSRPTFAFPHFCKKVCANKSNKYEIRSSKKEHTHTHMRLFYP